MPKFAQTLRSLFFLLPAGILGCVADGNPPTVEKSDSSGTMIVLNQSQDRELAWGFEEVLRLDATTGGSETFFKVSERGVGADADGQIYVLDEGNHEVIAFDAKGHRVRTIGGEGPGPGEFISPWSLFVTAIGEIRVFDLRKRAILRFAPDGSTLEQWRIPEVSVVGNSRVTPQPSGSIILQETSVVDEDGMLRPGTPLLTRIFRFEPMNGTGWQEPKELASIPWAQPGFGDGVGVPGCPRVLLPPIFTREPVWALGESRLFHNGTAQYEINILEFGGRKLSVRRAKPVQSATRELAAAEIGPLTWEFRGVSCDQSAEERADQAGWEDEIPWVRRLVPTPDGGMWVLRSAPGEDPKERIDIFGPEGEYIGTLPSAFPLPTVWRTPNEFLRVEQDEFQVPYVVVYRISGT